MCLFGSWKPGTKHAVSIYNGIRKWIGTFQIGAIGRKDIMLLLLGNSYGGGGCRDAIFYSLKTNMLKEQICNIINRLIKMNNWFSLLLPRRKVFCTDISKSSSFNCCSRAVSNWMGRTSKSKRFLPDITIVVQG